MQKQGQRPSTRATSLLRYRSKLAMRDARTMKPLLIAVLLLGEAVTLAGAQHKPASPKPAPPAAASSDDSDSAAAPDAAQAKAASTFAKSRTSAAKPTVPKAAVLTPLSPRERVVQLLDRF